MAQWKIRKVGENRPFQKGVGYLMLVNLTALICEKFSRSWLYGLGII